MWSCGVIIYLLLAGYAPFHQKDMKELFRMIRAADYSFHEKYWDSISTPAKKLITQMLTVDPSKRITAASALKSEWMTASEDELGRMAKMPLTTTVNNMKTFVARNKLRGAMIATTYATTAKFWAGSSVSFMSQNTTFNSSAFTSTRTLTKGKVGQTFNDVYKLDKKIRDGRISGIWIGHKRDDNDDNEAAAIKVIRVDKSNQKEEARIMNEVAILRSLDHPNVLKLIDFFEESPNFFLVMELMEGGDLFDRIGEKMQYTEVGARQLALSLLRAVEHIHSHCVAHRDLKPQNLLLKNNQNDVDVKVSDFSFAKRVHTPKSLLTRCGTPTYVAPEILKNHPHDEMADMWSVGVIIFVTLVGYPPFIEEDQRVLFRKIRLGEYSFLNEDWDSISKEAKNFITKLLVVDPDQRWTASRSLRHKWFTGLDSSRPSSSQGGISQQLAKLKISVSAFGGENRHANKNWQSFGILPDEN
jgi:Serine/threonine protein kinase